MRLPENSWATKSLSSYTTKNSLRLEKNPGKKEFGGGKRAEAEPQTSWKVGTPMLPRFQGFCSRMWGAKGELAGGGREKVSEKKKKMKRVQIHRTQK